MCYTIDYDDVLRWNQTIDGAFLLGPQDKLVALSDAVTSGQPADMLDLHSREVLGSQRVEMSFDVGTVLVETYNWESPVTVAVNTLTLVLRFFRVSARLSYCPTAQ